MPNKPKEEQETEESEDDGKTQAEQFAEQIMSRADLVGTTGKAIIIFYELPILTPRGRYNVELFPTFFKLHGKSYDFKVGYSSIVRLFQLPKPGQKVMFFIISLEPPIRRGNTSYPHLVFQLNEEQDADIDIALTEEYAFLI